MVQLVQHSGVCLAERIVNIMLVAAAVDIIPELGAEDSEVPSLRAREARLPKKALFSQVGRLTRPQLRADKRVVG